MATTALTLCVCACVWFCTCVLNDRCRSPTPIKFKPSRRSTPSKSRRSWRVGSGAPQSGNARGAGCRMVWTKLNVQVSCNCRGWQRHHCLRLLLQPMRRAVPLCRPHLLSLVCPSLSLSLSDTHAHARHFQWTPRSARQRKSKCAPRPLLGRWTSCVSSSANPGLRWTQTSPQRSLLLAPPQAHQHCWTTTHACNRVTITTTVTASTTTPWCPSPSLSPTHALRRPRRRHTSTSTCRPPHPLCRPDGLCHPPSPSPQVQVQVQVSVSV